MQKIIIVTAPSGAGKTSIVHYLLHNYPTQLGFSISATTRSKRANETDGVDYHFLTTETFNQKIVNKEFIEWEMVYEGKYYGTLKTALEKLWQQGKTPILDIDVKGAIHVQQQFLHKSLAIFIEPPSITALTNRLKSRGTETEESLQIRIDKASYELSFKNHFDAVIVNDDLTVACKAAEELVLGFLNTKA